MDKNSIIGLILIGCLLFGFSAYQSRQLNKQRELQAQADSVARVKLMEQMALDSFAMMRADSAKATAIQTTTKSAPATRYKDEALTRASYKDASIVKLRNDRIEIAFTTKGAQPYSVNLLDYKVYGGDSLYLVKPGCSDYDIRIYAGESINTSNFVFNVAEKTDNSVTFRLPFSTGGYIEQKYTLRDDSYMVYNTLSFINMAGVIQRNVTCFDIDWSLAVPRLEKGFKNEKQYSKLDVYCSGESKPEVFGNGKDADKRFEHRLEWFDFNQQFFSAIMTAPEKGFASGELSVKFADEKDPDYNLMYCSANLRNDFAIADGNVSYNYEFYFGPNKYNILSSYDRNYEKVVTIGGRVIGLITRYLIIPTFNFLSRFISNYGVIILLLTLFIKLIISPLTMKSYMSSAKMNAIKPEVDKLNEKYPKASTDQKEAMKKQQATMELYKRAGINPAGGCLPLLLQFPILWAMFRFFPASIELRQQPFLWAEDLSAYDSVLDFGFRILGMDHLSLFALLMAVTMFFYSKMTMPQSTDPQMAPMRFMSVWIMPIMMFFICNSLSAGLSYYYLLSNLVTMLQTFIIKKWFVKPEKILAQIEANRNKPIVKSKWQQRLEEAQKMAQQQKRRG